MNWIIENKEWIFSGAGIFVLGVLLRIIFSKRRNGTSFSIKSGNNCNNTQINANKK